MKTMNEKPTKKTKEVDGKTYRMWILFTNYRTVEGELDFDMEWEWREENSPACTVPNHPL